jgi:hypothetical protein
MIDSVESGASTLPKEFTQEGAALAGHDAGSKRDPVVEAGVLDEIAQGPAHPGFGVTGAKYQPRNP